MGVKIRNLSDNPVSILLNGGDSIHIAPFSESSEYSQSDVERNEFIAKLEGLGKIEVIQLSSSATPKASSKHTKTETTSEKTNSSEIKE